MTDYKQEQQNYRTAVAATERRVPELSKEPAHFIRRKGGLEPANRKLSRRKLASRLFTKKGFRKHSVPSDPTEGHWRKYYDAGIPAPSWLRTLPLWWKCPEPTKSPAIANRQRVLDQRHARTEYLKSVAATKGGTV